MFNSSGVTLPFNSLYLIFLTHVNDKFEYDIVYTPVFESRYGERILHTWAIHAYGAI